jgi:hypothetical protein
MAMKVFVKLNIQFVKLKKISLLISEVAEKKVSAASFK